MAELTFCKSSPKSIKFWLWEKVIKVSPKSFHRNLHLCYSQQSSLYSFFFYWTQIRLEILNIRCKFHLRMHPEGLIHGIHKLHDFWIFKRFVIFSFIKYSHDDTFHISICKSRNKNRNKYFLKKLSLSKVFHTWQSLINKCVIKFSIILS